MTALIDLLTTDALPSDTSVYAELLDGKFRPESLAVVVSAGEDALIDGALVRLDSCNELRFGVREYLWDRIPEELQEQGLFAIQKWAANYPENNSVFAPEALRHACLEAIRYYSYPLVEECEEEA